MAAMYAYRAYQEQEFLQLAIAVWEAATPYTITVNDAITGKHPLKQGNIRCNTCKLES